ncbi:MAG: hypothetical protein EXX96DRAFT_566222 [Benjaminiella poitrasii]|nr:MAG: hypothetical protein EXX96DRAFT_566222 [Benjaminiella poitrasii]
MTQQSDTRQSTTTTAHDAFMKATHLPTFSLPSNLNDRMVANKQHNNRPRLSTFRSKWLTQQSLEETAFAEDKLIDINLPSISKENLDTTLLSKEIHIIVAVALTLALASAFFLVLSHTADSPLYSTFLAGWLLFLTSFMFVGWSDMIMYMRTFALVMLAVTGWSYSHGLHKTALPQALSCVLFVVAERLNNTYGRIQDDIVKQRERYRAGAEEAIAQSLERYSKQRSLFLSTISQEIRDAGLMVMATLEQFSPSSILSNTHELLSACSIAVPIASISAINTTIQEACHISSHLNLISKMLKDSHTDCTIPEDKIMKLTVNNEFDAGEVIQNIGDALAGMSAKLGVHFVIYHVDNGFYYPNVIGNEDAIKHALINLLRNMLEGCTPGACIELGLIIAPIPDTPKVKVTFDITQNASPAIPIGLSTAFIPNANFTSQLLNYIGGKMELEDLGKNRTRVEVSLELYPGSNTDQRLLLIEKPSQILEKQLANIRFSNEPTLEDLSAFLAQLKGVKLILHAPEKSMFAKHLTSCLTTWNTDISHLSILGYTEDAEGNNSSSSGGGDAATVVGSDSEASSVNSQPLKTPLEKHATLSPASSRSINSANTNSSKIPSPAIEEDHIHSIPPAFILIDDDVLTLEKKLREFRDKPSIQQHQTPLQQPQSQPLQQPQSQPPTVHSQRRHHRSKSRQNGHENTIPQSTVAIIFFTSLINYKRVRDTIHWFNSVGQSPSLPRVVVVPKPAGPRRFLTALHTAWHNAIVEPQFIPIATSPLSPFVSPHCFPSPGILQDPNSSGSSAFMTPGTSLMTPHDGASRSSPGRRPPGAPPTSALRAGLHSPSNLYLESEKGGYFFDSAASRPSKLNTTSPLLSAATTNATKKLASPVLMPLNTTTTSNTSAIPGLNSSSSGDNCSSAGDTASNTGSIGNMNAPPNEIKRRLRSQSNAYAVPTVGRRNLVDLSLSTVVSPSTLLSANHVDPTKRTTYPEVEEEEERQTASSCTNSAAAGAAATDMCQHPSASLMEDTHAPIMETPPTATKATTATTTPSNHGVNQNNSSSNTTTPDKSSDASNNNNNAAVMDANLAQQTTVPSSNATNTTTTTTVVPPPPSAAATAVPQGSMMKPKSTKFNFKLSNRKRKEKTNGFDNKQSPPITVLIVEGI